jgi:hypothetical protein
MAVAIFIIVFVGFARTYFLRSHFEATALPPLLQVHGAVLTGWMVLLIAQTVLVAGRQIAAHRRLGVAGAILAPVVAFVGILTVIIGEKKDLAEGETLVQTSGDLLGQFAFLFLFVVFVAFGIWFRRQPETHKRCMLLATVSLLPPGIARLGAIVGVAPALLLFYVCTFACVLYDWRSRRRIHPVSWTGGLTVAVFPAVAFGISRLSDAWVQFTSWLLGASG